MLFIFKIKNVIKLWKKKQNKQFSYGVKEEKNYLASHHNILFIFDNKQNTKTPSH